MTSTKVIKDQIILLLIDPQNDFHEGGSLEVPGSHDDSERIAKMIMDNLDQIKEIYVTLDTHHVNHIGHAAFWWKDQEKKTEPIDFEEIRHEDVVSKKFTPKDQSLMDHVLHYSQQLENKGNFTMRIWPEHCLIGTSGHAVVECLNDALQNWSEKHMKIIEYIHKGENCLTEMYSAIEAEVPIPTDPNTQTNIGLISKLKKASKLLICGQAKSHTVNYTTKDIVKYWIRGEADERASSNADRQRNPEDIILLEDGMSNVSGSEKQGKEFLELMSSAEKLSKHENYKDAWNKDWTKGVTMSECGKVFALIGSKQ